MKQLIPLIVVGALGWVAYRMLVKPKNGNGTSNFGGGFGAPCTKLIPSYNVYGEQVGTTTCHGRLDADKHCRCTETSLMRNVEG